MPSSALKALPQNLSRPPTKASGNRVDLFEPLLGKFDEHLSAIDLFSHPTCAVGTRRPINDDRAGPDNKAERPREHLILDGSSAHMTGSRHPGPTIGKARRSAERARNDTTARPRT
ncbi:hypothetical protein Svir_33790 [Saccharomonospora viridis DSM 43017]|uniref:Uncharacterized protein n=1 Tax=Saccharomonospora viridis (strain ATCC 15386 / DSM 43017 / JCM 3036 / CCUG 5913 / NBRC 12207 / NCIMB 9602 / P101) TaxID=471857 RepID=C7N0E1_SACVD|nr:hypothetical protein Svir_33790 [Saccharomonospora viridis DSM 43017]